MIGAAAPRLAATGLARDPDLGAAGPHGLTQRVRSAARSRRRTRPARRRGIGRVNLRRTRSRGSGALDKPGRGPAGVGTLDNIRRSAQWPAGAPGSSTDPPRPQPVTREPAPIGSAACGTNRWRTGRSATRDCHPSKQDQLFGVNAGSHAKIITCVDSGSAIWTRRHSWRLASSRRDGNGSENSFRRTRNCLTMRDSRVRAAPMLQPRRLEGDGRPHAELLTRTPAAITMSYCPALAVVGIATFIKQLRLARSRSSRADHDAPRSCALWRPDDDRAAGPGRSGLDPTG